MMNVNTRRYIGKRQ